MRQPGLAAKAAASPQVVVLAGVGEGSRFPLFQHQVLAATVVHAENVRGLEIGHDPPPCTVETAESSSKSILSWNAWRSQEFSSLPDVWYTGSMRGEKHPSPTTGGEAGTQGRRYAILFITLLALTLRLLRLSFQPLWWDEGWSLYFATTDVGAMLELTAVDIHPPLYYLLLHVWLRFLGTSPIVARLLSVCIGTATVPLLYTTGRRLLGDKGGLLAACLLAMSPFHVYYSQEVRMYGLVALLGLAALYFAARWELGNGATPTWGVWLGYVLAASAALYAQYYAAFLLLALNLVVLLRAWRTRRPVQAMAPWLGAQVGVLLLYLPWLGYAGGKLLTYVRFKVGVEKDVPLGFLTYLGRHLAAFNWGHAEGALASWWWLGLLPLAVLVLVPVFLRWQRPREGGTGHRGFGIRALGWVVLLTILACGFAVNLVFPFNPPRSERLLLLALPVYLLLVAATLLSLGHHRRVLGALTGTVLGLVALLSLGFFFTVPRYPADDYRPLAARVRALALPGDAVLCIHPWQVGYFKAYLAGTSRDGAQPALALTPRQVIPYERQLWAGDPALLARGLDALLAGHQRLWLADHRSMGRVLESQIETYLVAHAYPVLSEWHGENTVLSLFAAGEPGAQAVPARFGDWLSLEGVALSPGPLQAGWGVLTVDLTWQVLAPPVEDYHLGLRLADAAGRVWAQRDAPPGGGRAPFPGWLPGESGHDHHGLLVPAGTPPGDYRLTLRVYRREDMGVLPVSFEGGSGGEVSLGTVRVARPDTPPPAEALALDQPLRADFGQWLRLLGVRVSGDLAPLPGEAVEVELFWQALDDPGQDFLPRLQLLDAEGEAHVELTEKPVAGTYPTAWWRAGELVRDPHTLLVPAAVPAGHYRLALSLIRAADGVPVDLDQGRTVVDLAQIEVRGRDHRYEPAAVEHAQRARFGTSVELIGYDLAQVVPTPGSALEVILHWHALATPDRDYHAFVHLLDASGKTVAQHDGPPGSEGRKLPTLGWLPGEYLTDTHLLQLPSGLANGEYRLGVGLYDPRSWQRLGERVVLDTPLMVNGEP